MKTFFERLDEIVGIKSSAARTPFFERAAYIFLCLTALSAPHSIAATQTSWLVGALFTAIWIIRARRVEWKFGLLDSAMIGLFAWSVVTSFTSYDPATSLDKLRGAAVFVIFYFAVFNLRTTRSVLFIAALLIGSCMVNVVWVPIERMIGRGVEIHQTDPKGPLGGALLYDGDTLLTANKKPIRTPEDLAAELQQSETVDVRFYRPDFEFTVKVNASAQLSGETAMERLGIGSWKKSRNWRSAGFYGHYTTYAEVLQLIGSLLLGFLVAGLSQWRRSASEAEQTKYSLWLPGLMIVSFALLLLALLFTVTRAPQLGLLVSGAVIALFGLRGKWLYISALMIAPFVIGGLLFLQQSRQVGFLDSKDESTRYRTVMLKDGIRIWTESPRNFLFGVGMDSVKKNWQEWGMFEGGKLPLGHFHSTPIQLVVERGLPAILIWLIMLYAYSGTLIRLLRSNAVLHWGERGIVFGALGGLAGFVVSSLVHYNFGDQEVVMVFYLIMALSIVTARLVQVSSSREPI
ncbi:O-antigen ligase family protein [Leptolyngbya sp. 7M]|uniref:O-antigen ligase family protein n=1 Tax=Leptolyngbya sp. 7M TaxID=2812896 RepID=UPI001B8C9CE5|nr:O-antigen ligase family protein [Leptolyngbya sp. 7M]QYO66360.1 O-antigen ligase family protein [Leptolyngbya sp. 7M]